MKLIVSAILCLFLFSCTTLKIDKSKRNITQLAIDLQVRDKVNPMYVPMIDSIFDGVITRFNNESHSYKVHRKIPTDTNFVSIVFKKGRFASDGERIAGYAISAIGILAAPYYSYTASNKQFFVLFYYFPHDRFKMFAKLSPSLAGKFNSYTDIIIDANALFVNKVRRKEKMATKLNDYLYKMLLDFDVQIGSQ